MTRIRETESIPTNDFRTEGTAVKTGNDSIEMRRLATKVAWLYHERGLRQGEIGDRLGISQSKVSRLLEMATSLGIVRTVVVPPSDLHADLEVSLEELYGLEEAHVFDVGALDDTELTGSLGRCLAMVLQTRSFDAEIIGLTSWSRSLREMIDSLDPLGTTGTRYVVEMLGDVGPPQVQHAAAHATSQLASLTGAEPMFLRVSGVSPTPELRANLIEGNRHAQTLLTMLDHVDVALVGVGTCEIVEPLTAGDNFFTAAQFASVAERGAVGEVNLRFIDANGQPVVSELDDLIVGITLEQLSQVRSRFGVAGGVSKYQAIRATLLGRWLTMLVTDVVTAQWLIANHPSVPGRVEGAGQAAD